MSPSLKILSLALIGTSLAVLAACGARSAPASQDRSNDSGEPYTVRQVEVPRKGVVKHIEFPSGQIVSLPRGARLVDGGIIVRSPEANAQIVAGASFPVLIESGSDFSPTYIWAASKVAGGLTGKSTPLKGTMRVPVDAVGEFTLMVQASNGTEVAVAEVPLRVLLNAELQGISIAPKASSLSDKSPSVNLSVVGQYDDGIQRTLTRSGVPIEFWSEDPQIATVNDKGIVAGVSVGKAVIKAKVGGHESQMTMHVQSVPRTKADRRSTGG